jgi:hypothetical protein
LIVKYHYKAGSVRWFRHDGDHDVRSHRSPNGWDAHADLIDHHPITGKPLRRSEWWIRETFSGGCPHESLRELCEVALRCLREDEYPELREQIRQALCS